ncbi:MAG: hypothetical protein AAB510_02590 [Patescibacteria group bacterium]
MLRFILPIILLGIAVAGFFAFTNPLYTNVVELRGQVASYDEALKNSKALENQRDKLTAEYNALNTEDLAKLQKLLPDSIDNIRLILEIEKIAAPYGMVLRDVKYDAIKTAPTTTAPGSGSVVPGGATGPGVSTEYGVWDLSFSIVGTYENFLNFTRDLESNLRIVDVSSITFSSEIDLKSGTPTYKHDFKIKTYWLKN